MSFAQSGMVPFAKLMPAFGVCLASAGVMYYVVNVQRAFGGALQHPPALRNPTGRATALRHATGAPNTHAMAALGRLHRRLQAGAGSPVTLAAPRWALRACF